MLWIVSDEYHLLHLSFKAMVKKSVISFILIIIALKNLFKCEQAPFFFCNSIVSMISGKKEELEPLLSL